MKCPNCNHENPEGNKFCAECGTKLMVNSSIIKCPNCHNQIPADSKFCPYCGTPITLHAKDNSRNLDKSSILMKLLTLGDFKIGDNIYDVECEDYTKIDDDGWGFKVIKASIDDDGFKYIARVSDKRIFALAIDLAECEDSIPENWKEIGIKDNNILTSFEKVLSRLNFDWEDIDSPGDGISFISSTKWNGENIFIVGSNSDIVISLLDDETKANIYAAIKEDLDDETNESENDDDELPSCPECGSDDVDDDGSDYLQYTCNDCGHNWGHYDTVECPECGSDDVENDGTDYMQYECNACGHIWGDDEVYDNDDEEDELNYDHPLSLNDFFPVCGITLNKSTVKDAERQSYRYAEIEYCDGGLVIAFSKNGEYRGAQIRKEANSNLFTHIYITSSDIMFPEWSRLGFDFKLSYNDWISLFKSMGFTIIQTEEPRIKSWEHGSDYFHTTVVAISKDYSLKFELHFSFGRDGNTLYSPSTLYSISVYSKDYSFDYGGHIGKKTFYNIEDFLRKEPKKYL